MSADGAAGREPADRIGALGPEWVPPYLLEADTWCFAGIARTRRMAERVADARLLSLLGWTPVLVQATRYHRARSIDGGGNRAYVELSATGISRAEGWRLVPLTLLVNDETALELGRAYGFPKELSALRLRCGDWHVAVWDGQGRRLVAARGPGAFLLGCLRILLARVALVVWLPATGSEATIHVRAVKRVAPAVGLASPELARWAGGVAMWPLGFALQGLTFELGPPRQTTADVRERLPDLDRP